MTGLHASDFEASTTADPTTERDDLTDLLEQLHDEIATEQSPTPDSPDSPDATLTDPRDLDRRKIADTAGIESTGGIDCRPIAHRRGRPPTCDLVGRRRNVVTSPT